MMVNAENQLQLDKLTLLQLMEIPVRNDFDIQRLELKVLFPETPMPTDEIDKISENFLPQIKSASLKTDASFYNLKMAESGRLPKLTLGGALSTGYSSLNNGTYSSQFNNNFSQQLSVTLAVPIFNNLIVKSNIAIARINVQNAQLNEKQTKNDVRKNIELVYTNQVMAGKKLIATQEQMELEKRTYTDMETKFSVGAIGATEFLVEKNNYNKVALLLIQAKYDYVLKAKMVDFYLGKPMISN
jgi:outer membrane protein